jgi:hypothetical protein
MSKALVFARIWARDIAVVCVASGVAACSPAASPAPSLAARATLLGGPTVKRLGPAPFLHEPGLMQMSIATTTRHEWGSSTDTRMQVSRMGRVVCEFDAGHAGGAENHRWRTDVAVVRRARDPLRFEVRTSRSSNDGIAFQDACTLYELPANGACTVLLERTCTLTCTPEVVVVQRPGTGQIIVTASGDGEPIASAMVVGIEGNQASFTDAMGATAFDAGQSRTLLVIIGPGSKLVAIDPRPGEDTVVTITATGCSCCAR